jgi:putative endonuclease
MIRCKDNSVYTGITTDLERRMEEHFSKTEKCAKYTFRHDAIKLEIAWGSEDRKLASKLEYHIKHLSKIKKEDLISNPSKLEEYLGEKLDAKAYKVIKMN